MKYPVLHRNFVCQPTTPHGGGVNVYNALLEIEWIIQIWAEKWCSPNPIWGEEGMEVDFQKTSFY